MKRKEGKTGMMIALLLMSVALMANVPEVKAPAAITIMPDGTIYPSDAPMIKIGDTYVLTDDVYATYITAVSVQRSNVILDGNGHTLDGGGTYGGCGVQVWIVSNVAVKNFNIKNFEEGVELYGCQNCFVSRNNITNNFYCGIHINPTPGGIDSSYNTIIGNNITNNFYGINSPGRYNDIDLNNIANSNYGVLIGGFFIGWPHYNTVSRNNITNNIYSIYFYMTSNNTITLNRINSPIYFYYSSNNTIIHNDFIGVEATSIRTTPGYANTWDAGYPLGGNYWSKYPGVDVKSGPNQDQPGSDGIGDTPYVIDADNRDRYPFMSEVKAPIGISFMIVAMKGTVDIKPPGMDWIPAKIGDKMVNSTEICVSYDSWAKLTDSFGDIYMVKQLTQMHLAESIRSTLDKQYSAELDLKYGEIKLEIKYGELKTDTKVSTPNSVIGIRGTKVSVSYNNITDESKGEVFDGSANVTNSLSGETKLILGYGNGTGQRATVKELNIIVENLTDMNPDEWNLEVIRDIAISKISPLKNVISRGYVGRINLTIMNYGEPTETFNVTAYADKNTTIIGDETFIGNQTINLSSGKSTTITFTWNTTGVPYSNYTLTAIATPVPDESDTTDNTRSCWIVVTVRGDVNGDGECNVLDIKRVKLAFSDWIVEPNADLDNNGEINILDLKKVKLIYSGYIV